MMNRQNPDNWIQTYTGRKFWPLEPRAEDVRVEDIAHALSMICRFGGHCKRFYSVAEHCILVSQQVGIHGLLHDAAEAYLLDIPSPVKVLLPEYKLAEEEVLLAIYEALGITVPSAGEEMAVKEADKRMLATEKVALHKQTSQWALATPYDDVDILFLSPAHAEERWIEAFNAYAYGLGRNVTHFALEWIKEGRFFTVDKDGRKEYLE